MGFLSFIDNVQFIHLLLGVFTPMETSLAGYRDQAFETIPVDAIRHCQCIILHKLNLDMNCVSCNDGATCNLMQYIIMQMLYTVYVFMFNVVIIDVDLHTTQTHMATKSRDSMVWSFDLIIIHNVNCGVLEND